MSGDIVMSRRGRYTVRDAAKHPVTHRRNLPLIPTLLHPRPYRTKCQQCLGRESLLYSYQFICFSQQPNEVNAIIITILHWRKLRYQEGNLLQILQLYSGRARNLIHATYCGLHALNHHPSLLPKVGDTLGITVWKRLYEISEV